VRTYSLSPREFRPKLKNLTEFLSDTQLNAKIIFGTSEDGKNTRLSYAVLKKDTVNDYRKEFISNIENYSDKDPVQYGISDFEADTYQYLIAGDIPQATTFLKDPQNPVRNLDSTFIKSIRFTEFRFQNTNGAVMAVFKIYLKTHFLTSGNRFKFFLEDSVLTPFTKDVIVAPPRFDCILFNNVMFIFKKSNFERIFDYKKVFQAKATAVFAYFEKPKGYTIEGLEPIRAKCMKSRSRMRRLAIISQGAYRTFTFDQLANFSKQKGLKDPSFDLKNRMMKFQTTRAFFRLFEDMYVHSELTDTDYIASRKTRLRASTTVSL